MTVKRSLIVLLVLVLTQTGCGTRNAASVPSNVNDVHVPPIENRSNETGLENLLTDQVTQQLLADGRVELVDKPEADVIVQGVITDYQRIPLAYNDQDIVQLYKVRVEMALRLLDPETGKVLRQFNRIFRETRYSDINPPIETELDAKQRVVRKLARDVVTTVVEGWPHMKL